MYLIVRGDHTDRQSVGVSADTEGVPAAVRHRCHVLLVTEKGEEVLLFSVVSCFLTCWITRQTRFQELDRVLHLELMQVLVIGNTFCANKHAFF